MNDAIQLHTVVGDDGVLDLQIPLGAAEAKKGVLVTVRPLHDCPQPEVSLQSWSEFIENTYGSCRGLGLVRHEQGELESREPIE